MRPRPTPVFSFSLWLVSAYSLASFALWPAPARAAPDLDGFDEESGDLEERLADGDLDEEDRQALRLRGSAGTSDVHGESWVSVAGFERSLLSGKSDIGGMLVVGLALDRVTEGNVRRVQTALVNPTVLADDAAVPGPEGASPQAVERPLVAPALARRCVAAALRASGLGTDDARLD
ncbi:MAG TPA: hypothetical protein VH044_05885, partial [Polyangiaceae bacterium]|nr:hypothetical protein [Polyangiaceae bacterium]